MTTTSVDEKDLPALPEVEYANAPETLEDAIQRILHVEMLLEDLARAVEIAQVSGQFNILDGFRTSAEDYLTGKITVHRPDLGDFKVTVIEGEISKETQEAYKKKAEERAKA